MFGIEREPGIPQKIYSSFFDQARISKSSTAGMLHFWLTGVVLLVKRRSSLRSSKSTFIQIQALSQNSVQKRGFEKVIRSLSETTDQVKVPAESTHLVKLPGGDTNSKKVLKC